MNGLNIVENIKLYASRKGMSISELARALDKSPQNFNQQLKRGDFRLSDMEKIAAVLGVRFVWDFMEDTSTEDQGEKDQHENDLHITLL